MPEWKDEIRKRLAGLHLTPVREAEILEELSQHLDDRYQELRAGGATPDEAYRAAIAELSESETLARELRRVERPIQREPVVLGARRTNMLGDLGQDLRYGLRMLAKNPGFTAIAVITLALGIGANTAIFSLVNAVLLRPLPYSEPDRLILLMQSYPEKGLDYWTLSQANVAAYRDQSSVFEAIAAYRNGGANLTGAGEPERVQVTSVSADFFKVFGVAPVLGRALLPGEDTPGKDSVCVLSYSFWQRRFGGDPGVIGSSLLLNDVPKEVVGVMPEGFSFPPRWIEVAVWTPLVLDPQRRSPFGLRAVARLKTGVSALEAQAETTAILWNNAQQSPGFVASAQAPQPGAGLKTLVTPLKEAIIGDTDKPLVLLLGAVGLVLLICCANVANLLLARAVSRTKEISVRLALGATPGRIIRQLVTESLLLALMGAVAGTALAWWGVGLLGWMPVRGIPRIQEASPDLIVLAFTAAIAIATGLLFGLAPARQAYRLGLEAGLREGMRGGTSASARRTSSALVAAQFALSLLLLVGAGLLLKSFQRLISVNPGFQTDNILTLSLSLPDKKYGTPEQSVRFFEDLVERVRGLPGIEAAGLIAGGLAFSGSNNSDGYVVEGHEPPPGGVSEAVEVRNVSSGYFQTMGIPLLRGRDFTHSDRGNSPLVAIVDEALARRYWPEGDATGKRIRFEWSDDWMTIVGVVGGVRDLSLAEAPVPHLYLSHVQWPVQSMNLPMAMNLAVRTSGDPAAAISSVRSEVRGLDAGLPIYGVQTMVEAMGETLNRERLTNILLTAFALLAAGLAAVGIYGVMSVYVSSRTAEFGIRLALGAEPAHLQRSVLRRGLMLASVGAAAGTAIGLALTRLLSSLLFEVSATDPVVFAGVALFLMGLALGACYVPARRSMRVDPMVALRYE